MFKRHKKGKLKALPTSDTECCKAVEIYEPQGRKVNFCTCRVLVISLNLITRTEKSQILFHAESRENCLKRLFKSLLKNPGSLPKLSKPLKEFFQGYLISTSGFQRQLNHILKGIYVLQILKFDSYRSYVL